MNLKIRLIKLANLLDKNELHKDANAVDNLLFKIAAQPSLRELAQRLNWTEHNDTILVDTWGSEVFQHMGRRGLHSDDLSTDGKFEGREVILNQHGVPIWVQWPWKGLVWRPNPNSEIYRIAPREPTNEYYVYRDRKLGIGNYLGKAPNAIEAKEIALTDALKMLTIELGTNPNLELYDPAFLVAWDFYIGDKSPEDSRIPATFYKGVERSKEGGTPFRNKSSDDNYELSTEAGREQYAGWYIHHHQSRGLPPMEIYESYLLGRVYAHAVAFYDQGWDIVIEVMEADEVLSMIRKAKATTVDDAISAISSRIGW